MKFQVGDIVQIDKDNNKCLCDSCTTAILEKALFEISSFELNSDTIVEVNIILPVEHVGYFNSVETRNLILIHRP